MVINNEINQFSSAGDTHIETKLHSTDSFSLKHEYETIKKHMNEELKNEKSWYLIDTRWFEKYVKYAKNEVKYSAETLSNLYPGPIDNSLLLDDNDSEILKEKLQNSFDYELINEEGWDLLMETYGVVNDNSILARKVIELGGIYNREKVVEVYPVMLKLKLYNQSEEIQCSFSKTSQISQVHDKMKEKLSVSGIRKSKVWDATSEKDMLKLELSKTIDECCLITGHLLVLEVQETDGSWPYSDTIETTGKKIGLAGSYSLRKTACARKNYVQGLCGLSNLGNTCFMNSAIQCLSNVAPLSNHFISEKYKVELNRDNPLGMGGKLAETYANLIKSMWSGDNCSVSPREFKHAVSQFAPRFSGFQQHDSQELLSFLIDGLHEDLNRISEKPYIEMQEAGDRPMTEVALESWQNHRRRNDSIVVDTLHGLLRSTVDCPDCPRVSVTFDPFCYLPLPLPCKQTKIVEVLYVPLDRLMPITKYKVSVIKSGKVLDLHKEVAKITGHNSQYMVTCHTYSNKFQTIYESSKSINQIFERDFITFEGKKDHHMVPIYMRRKSNMTYNNTIFGLPLMIPCKLNSPFSYVQTYKNIYNAIYRFMTNKDSKDEIRKFMSTTSNIYEDYINENDDSSSIFNLFKIVTVNMYGTSTENNFFEEGKPLIVKENMYLCAEWNVEAYQKFVENQWEVDVNQPQQASQVNRSLNRQIQLQDCVKLFATKETLTKDDAWYCSSCKKHQQATKKLDLWMLPPVLIIQLKRFSYTRYLRDKLDLLVHFPIRNLDLSEHVKAPQTSIPIKKRLYNLVAVSNHMGGLGGGHYTAYAKNRFTGKWNYFDDSCVSEIAEESVVSKSAYMLVYQRQDLEEWLQSNPKKYGDSPFPYLQPLISPRVIAVKPPSYGEVINEVDVTSEIEDSIFSDDQMDIL